MRLQDFTFAITLVLASMTAYAQSAAAVCNYPYRLSAAQATRAQDNTRSGCASWSFTYSGTAPVLVETSQDATTWGTTGITVTSGALPTSSGFGVVKFTGYAPYFRIRSTGTAGQTVSGLLYGSLGLTASSGGIQSWQYEYTPLVVGEWTGPVIPGGNDTRTDDAAKGTIALRHNSNGGAVIGQFICKDVTITTGQTYRATMIQAPENWQSDGGAMVGGVGFRNPTSGVWAAATLNSQGTSNNIINWGSCNNTNCTVFTSFNGGFAPAMSSWGTTVPLTVQFEVTATNIDMSFWSAFGTSYPRGTKETVLRTTVDAAFTQFCFISFVPNGNYFSHLLALGFSQT